LVEGCKHTYVEKVTTAATCTTTGVKTFTCSVCGDSYTETIAALGHTAGWEYIENTFSENCLEEVYYELAVYCDTCGVELSRESVVETSWGHSFDETDTCIICGAVRIPTDANLKFAMAPGLSFQDYIGVEIYFKNSVGKNYDKVYAIAVQEGVETVCGTKPYGSTYTIYQHQVLSWAMAEEFSITLYGEKGGVVYKGETITASVEALAMDKIKGYATTNTKACTALVDMLNYGAAVQVGYNHNADKLPSVGEYGSYGTTSTPTFEKANTSEGSYTLKVGKDSVSMQAKVEIQFLFTKDISAYTGKATLNGEEVALTPSVVMGYPVLSIAVGASQMRETFTFAMYDANGNVVTKVYNVSVEAYAKAQIGGAYNDVVIAMMRYGDAVAAL
jgi:hypothetical protein